MGQLPSEVLLVETVVRYDHNAGEGPVQLSLRPKGVVAPDYCEFLPDDAVDIR